MDLRQLVRVVPREERTDAAFPQGTGFSQDTAFSPSTSQVEYQVLGAPLRRAIRRGRHWLLAQQKSNGCWQSPAEGPASQTADAVLLLAYLGQEESPLAQRLAAYLLKTQLADGGWALHSAGSTSTGTIDVSSSAKAYFALKLTGHDPSDEAMQRARRAILANGGIERLEPSARFFLALFGQIPYDHCPCVLAQRLLAPRWSSWSVDRLSSWSQAILIPLAVIRSMQPVRSISATQGIRELFAQQPQRWPSTAATASTGSKRPSVLTTLGRIAERAVTACQHRGLLPWRWRGLATAEKRLIGCLESGSLGSAEFSALVFSIVALECLGHDEDSPQLAQCRQQFLQRITESPTSNTAWVRPTAAPVRDTALAVQSLLASGETTCTPDIRRATRWLLDRQPSTITNNAPNNSSTGGWAISGNDSTRPDCQTTAAVLTVLQSQFAETTVAQPNRATPLRLVCEPSPSVAQSGATAETTQRSTEAIQRHIEWLLVQQNEDGGWGLFARADNRTVRCSSIAASHGAVDGSLADLTGSTLETLGKLGHRQGDPVVDRAVAFLRNAQQADGSWAGHLGVGHIYGTWRALAGLAAVGVPTNDPALVAGANWLLAHQQASGGWGESPTSNTQPEYRGQGVATATQTAWAVLALVSAGLTEHAAVLRAVRYLVLMQDDDGVWSEPEFTAAALPQRDYLRYDYDSVCYPLLALAQWAVRIDPLMAVADSSTIKLTTADDSDTPAILTFPVAQTDTAAARLAAA